MPVIHVAKPFLLNVDNSTLLKFEAGVQEVDQAIADHAWVKAHLYGATEGSPTVGTPDYAAMMLQRAAQAREAAAKAAEAAEAAEKAAKAAQLVSMPETPAPIEPAPVETPVAPAKPARQKA